MMFQLPEGTRLSERVNARNRLLQAYDEEVTIGRTLPRISKSGGFEAAEKKLRRLDSRPSRPCQRNAGVTASLLVAPLAPGKKQETSELANWLEKKRGKLEVLPEREK
jgi:hypothetical protein